MRDLLNFFTSGYRVYFWTGFWVLTGLTAGLIFVCQIPDIVFSTALIWSMGFCLIGGLSGFIFAVPKVISNSGGPATRAANLTTDETQILQENNNLTEISDWLTKVIIGASLVQLQAIPPFVLKVGRKMAVGVANSPELYEKISIFCSGIVVYFTTFGFVAGFLIMRLVISNLLISPSNNNTGQ